MSEDITQLLVAAADGDTAAERDLLEAVYEDLKRLSRKALREETGRHTLQPTALVHEAYLRLVNQSKSDFKNRAHFFSIAGLLIRRILVDHARSRRAKKRGARSEAVPWSDTMVAVDSSEVDLLDLNEVLERLEQSDPKAARIVNLRYFSGLKDQEIADLLGVTRRTVLRQWAFAKAFLFSELEGKEHRSE
jgi:RNA polymerase sigma factor (TIGR02999 family)